jgi:hypothetical protein
MRRRLADGRGWVLFGFNPPPSRPFDTMTPASWTPPALFRVHSESRLPRRLCGRLLRRPVQSDSQEEIAEGPQMEWAISAATSSERREHSGSSSFSPRGVGHGICTDHDIGEPQVQGLGVMSARRGRPGVAFSTTLPSRITATPPTSTFTIPRDTRAGVS